MRVICEMFCFFCFVGFSVALSRETQEEAGEDGGPAGQKRAAEEAAQGSGTKSRLLPVELTALLSLTPIRPSLITTCLFKMISRLVLIPLLPSEGGLQLFCNVPSDTWRFNV